MCIKHENRKIYRNVQKNISDFEVLIFIQKPMGCITSSADVLFLIKTFWCRWIIFIKENLILLICPFSSFAHFSIRRNNCLQLQKKYSVLLVALEILRHSSNAPTEHFFQGYWSSKMASLQCQSQSYLVCKIIQDGILRFLYKCTDQEKRHKNCYIFFLKF